MRTYQVTIEGKTPLLMHQDNIAWADRMEVWKLDPGNKAKGKAGDDRSPAYRWLGSLYQDGARVVMPTDNMMRSLMSGGAMILVGKGKKTFKAQTQSGIMATEAYWPLVVDGQPIPVAELLDAGVMESRTWEDWNALTEGLGFKLWLKRAVIGNAKHVRVRPRFERWSTSGSLVVLDEAITRDVLRQIGALAGQYAGLGDWRPSSRTPGPHGMFEFRVE